MEPMVSSKNNETESLAARMCAREEKAFEEFSDNFGPKLRAFLVKKKGMRVADAEDLAVSCISEASVNVEKYETRDEGSFEGWVYTIASHMHADWLKKNPVNDPLPENLVAPEPVEEDSARTATIGSAVHQAMDQLSDTDQMIVQLRYMEESRTFKEIGKLLNINADAARQRHTRALKHIEKILSKDGRITGLLRKVNTSRENKTND